MKIKNILISALLTNILYAGNNDADVVIQEAVKKLILNTKVLMQQNNELNGKIKSLEEKIVKLKNNEQLSGDKNNEFIVSAWKLRVRDLPHGKRGKTLGFKEIGNIVKINKKVNEDWYKIDENYIGTKFLVPIKEEKIEIIDTAIIRTKPIVLNENIVRRAKKGEVLEIIGKIKKWYVLKDGNFIYDKNVNKIK
jgi:nitrogen fixation protein